MKRWVALILVVAVAIWWSATGWDRSDDPSRPGAPDAVRPDGPPGKAPETVPEDPSDTTGKPGDPAPESTWRRDPDGRPIAGWVLDDAGDPVPGAVVTFIARSRVREDPGELPTVRTAEDGAFRLEGLREGLYHLRAGAPLHGAATLDRVPAGRTDLRLTLDRAGRIAVRLDLPDGTDAPDAVRVQVTVERRNPTTWELSLAGGRTAEELAFHVDGLPAGRYRVTARLIGVGIGHTPDIEVRRGETTPATITPTGGETLVGRVVADPDGKPVPGALVVAGLSREVPVVLMIPNEATAIASLAVPARTDAEGRFRIPGLTPGTYGVAARADGLQPAAHENVEVPRKKELVFRLVPGGTIEVLVLDREGRPVSGAAVSAEFGEDGFASDETDDRGLCRLPPLPFGPVRLTAETGGFSVSQPAAVTGSGVTRVTLRHPAGGASLAGSLTRDGQPVVDRVLTFESAGVAGASFSLEAQTGPDGAYRIRGLPVGPIAVVVNDLRRVPVMRRTAEIRPGENTLDIELPAGVLRIRVLGEVTGKPLPATHLFFDSGRHTWTDGTGRVTVLDIEEREHVVRLRAWGHVVKEARLTPGADGAETVVWLRSASWLHLTVLGPGGRPVPRPEVEVFGSGDRRLEHFFMEWDSGPGLARLALEPGTWTVKLASKGYLPAECRVRLSPEGTRKKIVLTPSEGR